MKFFLSAEIDRAASKYFNSIFNEIDPKIKSLENKNYGIADVSIGIIPIIVSKHLLEEGFFKERRLYRKKTFDADVRLHIDLKDFLDASEAVRKLMIVRNIIDGIRFVGSKEQDFNAIEFEKDILNILEMDEENL